MMSTPSIDENIVTPPHEKKHCKAVEIIDQMTQNTINKKAERYRANVGVRRNASVQKQRELTPTVANLANELTCLIWQLTEKLMGVAVLLLTLLVKTSSYALKSLQWITRIRLTILTETYKVIGERTD